VHANPELYQAKRRAEAQRYDAYTQAIHAAAGGGLTICDTGNAMPTAVAARLLAAPVPSQTGLGIGLYQASKQAQQLGYKLTLVSNSDGSVCFELARAAAS
jgi:hypothetical protein